MKRVVSRKRLNGEKSAQVRILPILWNERSERHACCRWESDLSTRLRWS